MDKIAILYQLRNRLGNHITSSYMALQTYYMNDENITRAENNEIF